MSITRAGVGHGKPVDRCEFAARLRTLHAMAGEPTHDSLANQANRLCKQGRLASNRIGQWMRANGGAHPHSWKDLHSVVKVLIRSATQQQAWNADTEHLGDEA